MGDWKKPRQVPKDFQMRQEHNDRRSGTRKSVDQDGKNLWEWSRLRRGRPVRSLIPGGELLRGSLGCRGQHGELDLQAADFRNVMSGHGIGPATSRRSAGVLENLNAPIAVARILRSELVHRLEHRRILHGNLRFIAQRRSRHRQQRAGPSYRSPTLTYVGHLLATNQRAHHFFAATSFKISICSRPRPRRSIRALRAPTMRSITPRPMPAPAPGTSRSGRRPSAARPWQSRPMVQ